VALLRSRCIMLLAAVSFGCVIISPATASAQMFGELAGGTNYVSTYPSGSAYVSGSSFRASLGWRIASNFRWRIDVLTNQFDSKDNFAYPCPSFGCSPSVHLHSENVTALTANGLLNVDSRGIFYLIAGAGFYSVNNASVTETEQHFGVSAGAGIAIPMGSRLRGVVEARWHGLLGDVAAGPSSIVPITIGFRY
jgi:hypothetical protein